MKVKLFTALFFLFVHFFSNPQEDIIKKQIVGIYKQVGSPTGLEIRPANQQGYIIQEIVINGNQIINRLEWQSAYIKEIESNCLFFYWHTGRFDDDITSNRLIVYNLTVYTERLIGAYFFPETANKPMEIEFKKVSM